MSHKCPNEAWWVTLEASKLVYLGYYPLDATRRALDKYQTHYTERLMYSDNRNRKWIGHWKLDWVYVT